MLSGLLCWFYWVLQYSLPSRSLSYTQFMVQTFQLWKPFRSLQAREKPLVRGIAKRFFRSKEIFSVNTVFVRYSYRNQTLLIHHTWFNKRGGLALESQPNCNASPVFPVFFCTQISLCFSLFFQRWKNCVPLWASINYTEKWRIQTVPSNRNGFLLPANDLKKKKPYSCYTV